MLREKPILLSSVPSVVEIMSVRWYRSFYVRIGLSFVLFSVALLVLQTLLFTVVRSRSPLRLRPPNTMVAIVAADLGAVLSQDASADLDAYLKREYGQSQPIYLVTADRGIVSNRTAALNSDLRAYVESLLQGGLRSGEAGPNMATPFVTAPVVVDNELKGIVVLPPLPPPGPFARELERLASVPGTIVLILLTIVAAAFIFEPARRRLKGLEDASRRLGAGDLTVRAAVEGGDEVAGVAAAFNRMAAELAGREEALQTSDRLRRQMLADVSHELKTPLTSMRALVETLRTGDIALDPATRERYFATLERETMRLDRLVKDLLDLSRLENGVTDLNRRVFATRRVFEHVLQRHQPEVERRRMTVPIDVDQAADQIEGDPDRLEQVIENLFANALRHTPDGGSVEMEAWIENGHAMLAMTDSGDGIPGEHLPHVFERFYKADAARAHVAEGSGLGLSIAKAIVERHGGTIGLTSRPGRTTFTIALPQTAWT
jgi:signal transduction histidine kinase